jgi:glyoxylase-like metal-dependent hydrolase (beta-lactamase superfamily II)
MSSIALTSGVRIHALQTGTVAIRPSQVRGRGHGLRRRAAPLLDREWTERLPILAWAIEHPEGLIVVDAGETARTSEPGYLPRLHPYYRRAVRLFVEPDEEIGPRLRALGLEPTDARWLVLTHLHTDHAGGLHHFRGVPTLVDATELRVAAGVAGRGRGYLSHRFPDDFDPTPVAWRDEAVGDFERSFALTAAGDVVLLPTPGHTPGHLSVLVRDGQRQFLLAGDVAYTDALFREGALDGVSANERSARRTLDRAHALAQATPTVVLPTHDPDSQQRLYTK